ncbi:MAG: MarC family protein, partial [Thermodesulfobacteriota bacterium]|nr:MarC family protein [Thermodesulfobacteriota bacterium]
METAKYFLTILVPLLIIMDPLGNLPFFLLFTKENTGKERRRIAAVASAAAGAIILFFGLTGDFVLCFLEISLPAFQLAGGFIFFIYSLQMLRL